MPSQTTPSGVAIARRRDSIVAALPRTSVLADGSALVRRVEVAALPTPLPVNADGASFSSSRVDDHARLRDAKVFRVLGWEAGSVLGVRVTPDGHVVLAPSAEPGQSTVAVDDRGRLCLSVALREVLGAEPGASVLVVPSPVPWAAVLIGAAALFRALGGLHVAALGLTDDNVRQHLSKMLRDKQVVKVSRGQYRAVPGESA